MTTDNAPQAGADLILALLVRVTDQALFEHDRAMNGISRTDSRILGESDRSIGGDQCQGGGDKRIFHLSTSMIWKGYLKKRQTLFITI
jgi:hypothetical protein